MIKSYNEDSSVMFEVAADSVQLCVTSFPGAVGHLTMYDTLHDSSALRSYAVNKFRDVSNFLFAQSPQTRNIYLKQLGEIFRVLKPDGVFILEVGAAVFDSEKDLFGSELSVLYPFIVAEDIVLVSPLRLRHDISSVVSYPGGERRVEHWFVFSKQEEYKHRQIPLVMFGVGGVSMIGDFGFHTSPESILRRIMKCFSDRGDLLLDPFGGLGTLAKVSEPMGRDTILYESSERVFNLQKLPLG